MKQKLTARSSFNNEVMKGTDHPVKFRKFVLYDLYTGRIMFSIDNCRLSEDCAMPPQHLLDRDSECNILSSQLDCGYRYLVVDANPRCGATSFFKKFSYLRAHSKGSGNGGAILFACLECGPLDFEEALLKADFFCSEDLSRQFDKDIIRARKGSPLVDGKDTLGAALIHALMSIGINALGGALGLDSVEVNTIASLGSVSLYQGFFETIHSTCTPAAYASERNPFKAFFFDFFKCVTQETIVVIDGAQHLSESALDNIIQTVESNDRVSFVLGFTEKDNSKSIHKALAKGTSAGLGTKPPLPVPVNYPERELITLLNEQSLHKKTEEELESIAREFREDIWALVLKLNSEHDQSIRIPKDTRDVYCIVEVFGGSVSLKTMGLYCEEKMQMSWDYIMQIVDWLVVYGFIRREAHGTVVPSGFANEEVRPTHAERLFIKEGIVSFFNETTHRIEFNDLKLLIHLSREIYPSSLQPVSNLARRYAEELLSRGIPAPSIDLLKTAFPFYLQIDSRNEVFFKEQINDLLLMTASLFVMQKYEEVVVILDRIPGILKEDESFELFFGIALNRTRDHVRAEKHLKKVFEEGCDIDARALAACYHIVNYLYLNKPEKAVLAEKSARSLSKSKFYPYVCRNAAALKSGEESIATLLKLLDNSLDDFCRGSIENNLGRAFLATKQYNQAEEMFQKASQHLATCWQRNEAIVFNNCAVLQCQLGNYNEALSLIQTAYKMATGELPGNTMQQLFIEITKAAILFRMDSPEYEGYVENLEKQVLAHSVRHTREVYYANRALFAVLADEENASAYIEALSEHRNVLRPSKTEDIVDRLSKALSNKVFDKEELWDACFDPPYLTFWFVNPISICEDRVRRAMKFVG